MGGLDVIDRRYRALHDRVMEVLGADARVRSVEVGGSVAKGTADEWSDLDITVVTEPEHHDGFVSEWPGWLADITPTVFARTPILPFIVNAVTDEGLTLDFVIWSGEMPAWPTPTGYTVGMLSGTRFDDVADALEYAVAEQLRGLTGPFITFLQREEHVHHLTGVSHLLGLLTTVFLAESGSASPGSKHWNHTYSPEQLAAVASLPPVRATREDLIAFGLGLAELLVTRARPLFARYERTWPAELASVAATRVHDVLGIDTRAWLH